VRAPAGSGPGAPVMALSTSWCTARVLAPRRLTAGRATLRLGLLWVVAINLDAQVVMRPLLAGLPRAQKK
jgi:hypothetical protein